MSSGCVAYAALGPVGADAEVEKKKTRILGDRRPALAKVYDGDGGLRF